MDPQLGQERGHRVSKSVSGTQISRVLLYRIPHIHLLAQNFFSKFFWMVRTFVYVCCSKNKTLMRIFVGILGFTNSKLVASRTKVGLAKEMGVSVKTVERALKGVEGDEPGWVKVGKGEMWGVREVEVVETRNAGNAENWSGGSAGFRGMKGNDGLLRDAEN